MHSSRMRTARLLTVSCSAGGEVCPTPPWMQILPECRPPLDAGPPWMQTPPCRLLLVIWPVMHAGEPTPPPLNRMTHRCKNITLPQTSFAGGKYYFGTCQLACICFGHVSENFIMPIWLLCCPQALNTMNIARLVELGVFFIVPLVAPHRFSDCIRQIQRKNKTTWKCLECRKYQWHQQ